MKIAIVIPWFGRELKGGAEQHAWQIASRLAKRGHTVEVLTTCCRSHQDDWVTNHFPEGLSTEPEGFKIRRFFVDSRNRTEFDRVCGYLLSLDPASLRPGVSPISPADSHIFTTELIKSARLLDFIRAQKEHFDAFIFLPYLYGLILDAIRIVGRTAALQPCLHDEAYAYLPEVADAFRTAGSLLFISQGEQELAFRLFGPGIWTKSTLAGAGVESSNAVENAGARSAAIRAPQTEKFLLYLGRKDAGKNVPLLLSAFARFLSVRPNSPLRLVLAGHGEVDLNGCRNAAVDLGLVSEEEKQTLLRGCSVLVQPSQNESFSRVMMEAWLHGKPVIAHARCLATAVAVQRAGGGWIAESESDWVRLFIEIDRMPAPALSELGMKGKRYAQEMADWESVIDRYEVALARHTRTSSFPPTKRGPERPSINQFLPNLAHGDAISNEAIFIRDQLRELGFRSEIYVRFIDPRVADQCSVFSTDALNTSSAIIYHHSIGTEITPHILKYHGPKCLIYHNITPAKFFEPFRPQFAAILRKGREDLPNLATHFEVAVGDSTFNAEELAQCGFRDPGVLPICVDPDKWNIPPDPELMSMLQDGRTNLIFVGRMAPNKKQDDLIGAFAWYLRLDPTARLFIIGSAEHDDPYSAHVSDTIRRHGIKDSVFLTGGVSDKQLAAYYHTAHLYWSMSEHEGFCVPLIEAMWFDVPVLAFRSSAVPETLGNAALLFLDKTDFCALAVLARVVVSDQALRPKLILHQRRQRQTFLPAKFKSILAEVVERTLSGLGQIRTSTNPPIRREAVVGHAVKQNSVQT